MTTDRAAPSTFEPARLGAVASCGLHRAPSEQLDRLTRLASDVTGVPVSLVSIVDDRRQFFASQVGLAADVAIARETPLTHSVCRAVVDRGRSVVIDDLAADAEFVDHPARRALGVESYCGVPVHDPDGHVLGSLCLIDSKPHHWTEANLALLESLSAFVTETIAVHQSYVRLVDDAQRRLLPDEIAQPARGRLRGHYRPVSGTSEIGGDFYDVLARPDGAVTVVVGDAVGHGIECSAAAAQLRAVVVAALAAGAEDPVDVVQRVNDVVHDLPGCAYSALLVGRIAPDGESVRWVRAGAPPPVNSSTDDPLAWERAANPPLGAITGPVTAAVVPVSSGDRVLFFTDGLVERVADDLDDAYRRLHALAADIDDLDDLVEAACPRERQHDDIAVVVWDV